MTSGSPQIIAPPPVPIPESYWVIPGRFLAGAYPGSWDLNATRNSLNSFLRSGIDSYIDLTFPHERQEYFTILQQEASEFGVQVTYDRFPIPDFNLPTPELMKAILDRIEFSLASGHNLYLHCHGGIGRTGTVVGCYLVRHGRTGSQALDHLQNIYKASAQSLFYTRSPETEAQRSFILNWNES